VVFETDARRERVEPRRAGVAFTGGGGGADRGCPMVQ
jgi:hypothetical protein